MNTAAFSIGGVNTFPSVMICASDSQSDTQIGSTSRTLRPRLATGGVGAGRTRGAPRWSRGCVC